MTGLVRRLLLGMAIATLAGAIPAAASTPPALSIRIDISSQVMAVDVNGGPYGRWKVSTGRRGYRTPRGRYRPYLLKKMHYSRKYDNSPMPNSIFFLGGYAIHGTYYLNSLGRPASHGCIRLHPDNALKLYNLVRKHGFRATRITIVE